MDKTVYQERDISWAGKDYSGLSLYKYYPVEWLKPVLIEDQYVLGYRDQTGKVSAIDGDRFYPTATCQAFPEKDAPFKQSLAQQFSGVSNVCEWEACKGQTEGNPKDCSLKQCECSYTKITYTSGGQTQTRWWDFKEENIPPATCDQERDKACENPPYNDPYRPLKSSKVQKVQGLENYCLEPDPSKPKEVEACLTWWPGAAVGQEDIYEQYPKAGFSIEEKVGTNKIYAAVGSANKSFGLNNVPIGVCQSMGTNGNKYLGPYSPQYKVYESEINTVNITVSSNDNWDANCAGPCLTGCSCSDGWWGNAFASAPDAWEISCSYSPSELKNSWVGWIYGTRKGDQSTTACKGGKTGDAEGGVEIKGNFSSSEELTSLEIYGTDGNLNDWGNSFNCVFFGTGGVFQLNDLGLSSRSGPDQIAKLAETEESKAWTDRIYRGESNYPSLTDSSFECKNNCNFTNLSTEPKRLKDTVSSGDTSGKYSSLNGIKDYFAQGYKTWTLASDLTYTEGDGWDISSQALSFGHQSPQTRAVTLNQNNKEAEDPNGHPMSINGKISGEIAPPGATSYLAVLKFYAWVDKNHMPIRELVVDWGDDSFPSGLYSGIKGKNRRQYCISEPKNPDNQGWGGQMPDACTQGYFQFVHTYICQAGGADYDKNTNKCYFTPKVYVKDNWDWCNDGSWVGNKTGKTCWSERKPVDQGGQAYDNGQSRIILSPVSD